MQKGKETRSLSTEEQLLEITAGRGAGRSSPSRRQFRGRGGAAPKPPLREFGTDPVSERPVVAKDGRFGVYVTDGETNASLGRGDRLEEMPPERAYELLAVRREQVAEKGAGDEEGGQEHEGGQGRREAGEEEAGGQEAGRQGLRRPARGSGLRTLGRPLRPARSGGGPTVAHPPPNLRAPWTAAATSPSRGARARGKSTHARRWRSSSTPC